MGFVKMPVDERVQRAREKKRKQQEAQEAARRVAQRHSRGTGGGAGSVGAPEWSQEGACCEALLEVGCWSPATVEKRLKKQAIVRYDVPKPPSRGRVIEVRENETPLEISDAFGLPVEALLAINADIHPGLEPKARLKARTEIRVPQIIKASEDTTPSLIASRYVMSRYGVDIEELVALQNEMNRHKEQPGAEVTRSSKYRPDSLVLMPALPAISRSLPCPAPRVLPPQPREIIEVEVVEEAEEAEAAARVQTQIRLVGGAVALKLQVAQSQGERRGWRLAQVSQLKSDKLIAELLVDTERAAGMTDDCWRSWPRGEGREQTRKFIKEGFTWRRLVESPSDYLPQVNSRVFVDVSEQGARWKQWALAEVRPAVTYLL